MFLGWLLFPRRSIAQQKQPTTDSAAAQTKCTQYLPTNFVALIYSPCAARYGTNSTWDFIRGSSGAAAVAVQHSVGV